MLHYRSQYLWGLGEDANFRSQLRICAFLVGVTVISVAIHSLNVGFCFGFF